MKLIIVESPTKARTLTRFLKGEYQIEATLGHIRDLPKAALGVDVAHNFQPKYIIPKARQKRVGELKKAAKKADRIILATDPDREGEAIAWHAASVLSGKKANLSRIVFHEITESAIKEALAHPRLIDTKLVDAQQARRVLDRLVGYTLSPLLWKKLSKRWLSAGRVQSVAVRLIAEREREIDAFKKQAFWTIEGVFQPDLHALLLAKAGMKYEKILTFNLFDGTYTTASSTISSEEQANAIIADFSEPFTVSAVDKKEIKRYPGPPYTTSTLQQDAGRKLYFSSKKTMQLAQKLYEEGYISYHRTDSVHLSEKFTDEARDYITKEFGKTYVPDQAKQYQTKSKVAQEAHEAIRPTEAARRSDAFTSSADINRDHIRLYDLIWKRAVASQAREAVFDATTISITSSNGYQFIASGSILKFDGFLIITGRDSEDIEVPNVTVGDTAQLKEAIPSSHETSPPPRYSEASLVKALEEKDIGRPSTYAPIISTIQDRQYVEKEDLPAGRQGKRLKPTELGFSVTDFLVRYFPEVMGLPFTAKLEDDLDAIAQGTKEWVPVIRSFYEPFSNAINQTYENAETVKVAVETLDEVCPTCGSPLVIRVGRYGKFIACSTFPACKYTRQFLEKIDVKCPTCGGDIVVKKSRRGKTFYGCSTYPMCTFAAWKKEDIK